MPEHEDFEFEVDIEERSSLAPFLFGVLVGAGAALLLAPAAGAETRRRVSTLLGQIGEQGPRGSVDAARTAATGWVDRARGAVDSQVERVRGAVDSRVERVRGAVEEGKATARQTGDELRRTLDEAKATYRAGLAGTPPPRSAPRVAPSAQPAGGDVVVGEAAAEEGRGDLAR